MKKLTLSSYILLLFFVISCKKNILDVENPNNPDFKKVYASGADILNVTSGLYNIVYNGENAAGGVKPMMATAADNVSCSYGNFGMRDLSFEPRNNAWDNSATYSNNVQTNYTYNQMYAAINTANLVIKAIDGGVQISGGADNNKVKAFARFIQGVAYGNLALIFDKSFIVDESKTVESKLSQASGYQLVADAAVKYLDEAILLSNNAFVIPASWMGTGADYSNIEFKKLCNTMAARILAYTPRNKTQLAAVNWAKVKTYADAGITSDFSIVMDGAVKWYDEAGDYLTYNGWGVTDMYVVNMMDPVTQPAHWDDSASFPYPPQSTNPSDKRLLSDFEYVPSNWLSPARGYYHFSSYRSKRYDDVYVAAIGPKPVVMLAENDMLRAEARLYSSTPDLGGAVSIINAGTRVTRGQMTPVAPVLNDLVKAIHHERNVEMYTTGVGLQFYEMRKLNLLQKGTPLHFPIPAKLLQTLGEATPYYTFGTVAKADGVNTSNAGWR